MVIGFLDNGEGEPWLVGLGCRRMGRDMIAIPSERYYGRVELIAMNEGPRRIAVYHACKYGDTCQIDRSFRTVRHSETPLLGGSFRIHTRSQGYPPRLA